MWDPQVNWTPIASTCLSQRCFNNFLQLSRRRTESGLLVQPQVPSRLPTSPPPRPLFPPIRPKPKKNRPRKGRQRPRPKLWWSLRRRERWFVFRPPPFAQAQSAGGWEVPGEFWMGRIPHQLTAPLVIGFCPSQLVRDSTQLPTKKFRNHGQISSPLADRLEQMFRAFCGSTCSFLACAWTPSDDLPARNTGIFRRRCGAPNKARMGVSQRSVPKARTSWRFCVMF